MISNSHALILHWQLDKIVLPNLKVYQEARRKCQEGFMLHETSYLLNLAACCELALNAISCSPQMYYGVP